MDAWPSQDNRLAYIDHLARQPEGWRGPGTSAATKRTTEDVKALFAKLIAARPDDEPLIGLDDDGIYCLSWHGEKGLTGCLAVHGDGTFSYYVEHGDRCASADDDLISQPLVSRLLEVIAP